MSIFLFLVTGILFAMTFVFWENLFQRNTDEMSSNPPTHALLRTSSRSKSTKSIIDKRPSVSSLSQDILNNFPHSIAMQKRILVNLRIVEHKLAELELFLVTTGFNDTLVNQKSTVKLKKCNNRRGNH